MNKNIKKEALFNKYYDILEYIYLFKGVMFMKHLEFWTEIRNTNLNKIIRELEEYKLVRKRDTRVYLTRYSMKYLSGNINKKDVSIDSTYPALRSAYMNEVLIQKNKATNKKQFIELIYTNTSFFDNEAFLRTTIADYERLELDTSALKTQIEYVQKNLKDKDDISLLNLMLMDSYIQVKVRNKNEKTGIRIKVLIFNMYDNLTATDLAKKMERIYNYLQVNFIADNKFNAVEIVYEVFCQSRIGVFGLERNKEKIDKKLQELKISNCFSYEFINLDFVKSLFNNVSPAP